MAAPKKNHRLIVFDLVVASVRMVAMGEAVPTLTHMGATNTSHYINRR